MWLPSSPFLPCVRTPGAPPAGACTARASYGHGRVVRPAPSLRCLPTLPLCPRGGGGGGALSAPPYLHPPPLGGRRCVGGGEALSSSLRCTHVAGTTQARRRHEARHLSLCKGGGMPCGSRRRPSYPALAPPVVPPLGLARRVLSTGTVVWSVPHPLAAASPPCRFVLGGGGAFGPPLPASPTLGGAEVCGGGRCALVVFPPQHARRRHNASMAQARGAALVPLQGGGACRVSPVVAPPTLRAHPRGGGGVWGGGGACRRPFVARMSQARRRVGFRTRTAHGTTHGNYPLPCPLCSLPRPLCSLGAEQSPCLPRCSLPLLRLSGLRSPPKCPTSFALPVPSSLVLAGPRCMTLRRHTAHCTFGGGLPCGSTPRHPALPSAPVRCGRLARVWGTLLPPSPLCHL